MRAFLLSIFIAVTLPCSASVAPYWYARVGANDPPLIYFEVRKTGTRTMHHLLQESFELDIPIQYAASYDGEAFKEHFKFAFVRNPWDRVVSAYSHGVVHGYGPFCECWGKSFEEFVDYLDEIGVRAADTHVRLQCLTFPVDEVDFIGRFENFEEDVREIFRRLGVEEIEVPCLNAHAHDHYRTYYDDRTREIIGRLYAEDIERFGYSF